MTSDPKAQTAFRIDAETASQTLAAALRAARPGEPWSAIRKLCERGQVSVGGKVETNSARRMREGELVAIGQATARPRAGSLHDDAIVHVDREVIVVDKPAGMLTVRYEDSDRDTLIDRAQAWLRAHGGSSGQGVHAAHAELGAVQRLDKDTSGVLVFTRTLAAKRSLQAQLRVHSVERRYLALVHGVLLEPRAIESYLIEDRGDGLRGSFGHFRRPRGDRPKDAQRAVTHVQPLESFGARATLIECRLETGRQHQIRIHLSELGHPLLGEQVYIRDYPGQRIECSRPMLHAAVLGFEHPRTQATVRYSRPAPNDFARTLATLAANAR